VSVAGLDIGELTYEEARDKIQKQVDVINKSGFVYKSEQKTVTISPTLSSLGASDTSYAIVFWDVDKSLSQVVSFQKNSSFSSLFNKLKVILFGEDFPIIYSWDRQQHKQILADNFADVLSQKVEASFYFDESGELKIIGAQTGKTFSYDQALADTEVHIKNLSVGEINLNIVEDKPQITTELIESFKNKIIAVAGRGSFYLTYEEKDWSIPNDIWRNWLMLSTEPTREAELQEYIGPYSIVLAKEKFDAYLDEAGIKETIEKPVQDARFKLQDGKVSEFISSEPGRSIDLDQSLALMNGALLKSGELETQLVVTVVEPQIMNEDINDLGIVEIIGTGVSDFAGSPPNRIHNIGVGADTLNGMLIPPGQEFSLVKALGEIDGEHGYLQELVIKGNRTILEYGGGLCQIGTTIFRAALGTGLDITERRNHSYRVSYYEPAGTDATIYSPWPDLKFINDTQKHVLIQSRIDGTTLYFDFWGTPDGRKATTTAPIIYNTVAPPPTKIIKTTELAPGQKRCTERAHYGADAKFDYKVTYGDGRDANEETFYSHYIPWQEVCLLGVTEEELAQENASSTPEDIE
ncbi:hypothetical protein C4566_02840, partial [Candidatus Parcubacteria bacterium]